MAEASDDGTSCPICTEEYTDPRALPCIHTFCLKCIRRCGKDKRYGDELPCPLCRKAFTIPSAGFEDLPKNFALEKVIQAKYAKCAQSSAGLCKECASNPSTTHCPTCDQPLCVRCIPGHRKRRHRNTREDRKTCNVATALARCTVHQKQLTSYCLDCNKAACMTCFISDHHQHECCEIDTDRMRQQLLANIEKVNGALETCQKVLQKIATETTNLFSQRGAVERQILDKAKQMKRAIDSHANTLVSELRELISKRMGALSATKAATDDAAQQMEYYKKYAYGIAATQSGFEMAKELSASDSRAAELLSLHILQGSVAELKSTHIAFVASATSFDDCSETFGSLDTRFSSLDASFTSQSSASEISRLNASTSSNNSSGSSTSSSLDAYSSEASSHKSDSQNPLDSNTGVVKLTSEQTSRPVSSAPERDSHALSKLAAAATSTRESWLEDPSVSQFFTISDKEHDVMTERGNSSRQKRSASITPLKSSSTTKGSTLPATTAGLNPRTVEKTKSALPQSKGPRN